VVASAALAGCGDDPVRQAAPAAAATATPTPAPTASPDPQLPAPGAPLPRSAAGLAAALEQTSAQLRGAVRGWDGRGEPPEAVTLLALHEQRLELRVAGRRALLRPVLARLRPADRADLRDGVLADRELTELSSGWPVKRRHRVGPPEPAAVLWRHYRAAHRRFGVSPTLLAAVNLVESAFGRMRNESVSGAQGPMQFMPATWRAYGLGGDVHDPRDAIMGAANYLRANGAQRDEARALYHYNPSLLYVRAVERIARRMRRRPEAFRALYARQVFVRTARGRQRITGP
jgi:soluble lytic murein transglycosylase-like protein